jgi:hypothetical protein
VSTQAGPPNPLEPERAPSPAALRWAWQLVAVRAGALDPAELPDPAPVDPATAARATTMLIARLARRHADGVPVEEWAPDLLAWLLAGATGPADDRGLPVAVAVLIAAAIGYELPGWIDRHGGTASADLPALTDVCWALAYALDATHHRPGLADIAVADLLHPRTQ